MVATRATRKRLQRPEDPQVGPTAMTNAGVDLPRSFVEEADRALEQAQEVRARKAKQRRIESFARNHPPFETLPTDTIQNIFLFLDSARDVYNLAFCSRYLRDCLTPEIVVRSAVFGGGRMKEALETVMFAVGHKSIHVPSTLRLLRLVNGRVCERGDQCYGFNLTTKLPQNLAKTANRPFGLMICPLCVKGTSANLFTSQRNNFLLEPDRIEIADYSRVLCHPHVEAVTGERSGPLVLANQLKQIETTYSSKEEMLQALDSLLEEIDENTPDDDFDRAAAFTSAYTKADSEYEAFEQAKKDLDAKRCADRNAQRVASRRKKAQAVFAQLETLLEDYIHKGLVLGSYWTDTGYFHFKYKLVDDVLGPLLRAPSSATQKKITSAANSVRETVDLLYSNGFVVSSNFLFFIRDGQRQYQKTLYRYCMANISPESVMKSHLANETFVGLVRNGKPFDALLHVLLLHPNHLRRVFSCVVVDAEPGEFHKFATLANKVWSLNVSSYGDVDTEEKFIDKFYKCRGEMRTLISSIQDYLADPLTVEFLEQTEPPPHRPWQQFTRMDAVDKMYENEHCLRFLSRRQFASLRSLHDSFFRNPGYYGFHDTAND